MLYKRVEDVMLKIPLAYPRSLVMNKGFLKLVLHVFSTCDYFIPRWPFVGDTARNGLNRVSIQHAFGDRMMAYVKGCVVIYAKE